jgi:hypothetical protein
MRADIHDGQEHDGQERCSTRAGYISARPTSPSRKPLATHGRSIHTWVKDPMTVADVAVGMGKGTMRIAATAARGLPLIPRKIPPQISTELPISTTWGAGMQK